MSNYYIKYWPQHDHIRKFSVYRIHTNIWCLHSAPAKGILFEMDSKWFPQTGTKVLANVNTHKAYGINAGSIVSIDGGNYILLMNSPLLKAGAGENKHCVGCGVEVNTVVAARQKGSKDQVVAHVAHKNKHGLILMTFDHIIPKSKGGRDKQLMCYHCNQYKADCDEFYNPTFSRRNFKWPPLNEIVNIDEVYDDLYIRTYNEQKLRISE